MLLGHTRPMMPVVQLIGPEDISTGANSSLWVSMENVHYGMIVISMGDVAADAAAVTLDQAVDSSGTSTKTLSFDYMFRSGLRIAFTGRSAANFQVAEAITGGTSSHVMTSTHVSSDQLTGYPITAGSGDSGTTYTDGETITGGTSGATATVSGTGTDEDISVRVAVGSDTFNIDTLQFKQYIIMIDHTMLDADNDFNHFQLDIAKAGSGNSLGSAIFIPLSMRTNVAPQISLIGAQKIV